MVVPIGLVGTLIAIVQISSKVVSICYDYRRSVKNAPREISQILDEVASIRNIVERLVEIADDDEHSNALPSLQSMNQPDSPLAECLSELTSLKSRLKPEKGLRAKGRAFIWPFKEAEVYKSLDTIIRIKGTLQLAISADNAVTMVEILASTRTLPLMQDKLSTLTLGFERMGKDTKVRKILDWLSAPDLSPKHESELQKHVRDTGQWFFNSEAYVSWKCDPDTALWLNGFSGCGKTVLCAAIIEDIRSHCAGDPYMAMAYLYFDSNSGSRLDANSMLRTLITQLVYQTRSLPTSLVNLYEKGNIRDYDCYERSFGSIFGSFNPPVEAFEKVLHRIADEMDHVYFVFDALDECKDIFQLRNVLKVVENIHSWSSGKVHLLTTSRSLPDIQECFETIGATCIRFDTKQMDPDIRRSIRARLSDDPKMRKWLKTTQQDVETKLMAQAQGMFRWLDCQLQMLRKCSTPTDIRRTLQSMPKSLEETYSKILKEIDDAKCLTATRILQWLAFSMRPVAEALAIDVDPQDRPHYDPDLLFLDMGEILDVCSSLLTTVEAASDHPNSSSVSNGVYVKLAHSSVKEFLMSDSTPHLTSASTLFASNALQAAAQGGHIRAVQKLLDASASIDAQRGMAQTALTTAASGGHEAIVRLLLERGAKPQNRKFFDDRRGDALFVAAGKGYAKICELLLDYGALDYWKMKASPGSALHAATLGGHRDVVHLILLRSRKDDVPRSSIIRRGSSSLTASQYSAAALGHVDILRELMLFRITQDEALRYAARAGDQDTVERMLTHGANIDSSGRASDHQRALQAAARSGHVAIVRKLLSRGADPNLESDYSNALYEAAERANLEIIRLLVEAGANVNPNYARPLTSACSKGNLDIFRVLVAYGADVNANNGEALHAAAGAGNVELIKELINLAYGGSARMVRFLLELGVNPNCEPEDPNISKFQIEDPMFTAIMHGNSEVVGALLDGGVDLNKFCRFGTPLCEAIRVSDELLATTLLARGADVNLQKDKMRDTPLLYAIDHEMITIVKLLLERRADPNKRGIIYQNQPKFPLLLAAEKGNPEIARHLVAAGARVNEQNDQGFSALHGAAGSSHDKMLKLLIEEYHAELGVRLLNGSLPIHTAAARGNPRSLEVFLDAGVDIDATNNVGRTPLHWAAEKCRWDNVQLLLDRGARKDVKADGELGLTPLDLAHIGREGSTSRIYLHDEPQWSDEEVDTLFERMGPSKA